MRATGALTLFIVIAAAGVARGQPAPPPPGLLVAPVGSAATVNVSAYFQPFQDSESVSLWHLERAQRSVHVAHYNIRNPRFYDALDRLRQRGVEVKLITDEKQAAHPWNWLTQQFITGGFDVLRFTPPTSTRAIMHLKAAVIDEEKVLTGSYNWNFTAQLSNDENMLVIEDKKIAGEFRRFMDLMRSNQCTTWRPTTTPGSPIEVHFAPANKPGGKIQSLIDRAQKRVTIGMFAITEKWISESLKAAVRRGIPVEIVTEFKQTTATGAKAAELAAAGCKVVVGANTSSSFSAMHHKYAVIDDVVVTGACNWTTTAFYQSAEDVVIVRDAALARTFRHNWKALIKRYDPQNYDPYQFLIASPEAHVQFVTKHDRTAWGDRVFVVGDHPGLGSWDPAKAIELRTSDDVYPRWSASVTLPAGAAIEYKYLTRTAAGETFWEHGDNRKLAVDGQGTDEARIDEYRFP